MTAPARNWIARALDGWIAWFAAWTITCHLLVYTGRSFPWLVVGSWVALAGAAVLFWWIRSSPQESAASSAPMQEVSSRDGDWIRMLAGAVLCVALFQWARGYVVFWAVAVAFAVVAWWRGRTGGVDQPHVPGATHSEQWQVLVLAVLAMMGTWWVQGPDLDDAFYLNVPVSTLDHPDRPLLRFDGMYGEEGLPLLSGIYRAHSHELLVSWLAHVIPFTPAQIYYLLLPSVSALFVVFAHWLALRECNARVALLGLVFVILVWFAWGHVPRAYGHFSFVRLSQGKGVLVSVCIPALVYAVSRYLREPNGNNWLRVALLQIAMVGVTSTGLIIGPLVTALMLVGAGLFRIASPKTIGLGLLSSAYLGILAIAVVIDARGGPRSMEPVVGCHTRDGIQTVIGPGFRSYIAMLALMGSVALPVATTRFRAFVLVALVVLFNPWIPGLASRINPAMCWRVFWAVPFPLIIGLTLASLFQWRPAWKSLRLGAVAGVCLILCFLFSPYRHRGWRVAEWATAPRYRGWHLLPRLNHPPAYEVAEDAISRTPPDGTILAHFLVAAWVPTFSNAPRLIGVRENYFSIIAKAVNDREAGQRSRLFDFVRGTDGSSEWLREVVEQVEQRKIDTIVIHRELPVREAFETELRRLGYQSHPKDDYRIWVLRN